MHTAEQNKLRFLAGEKFKLSVTGNIEYTMWAACPGEERIYRVGIPGHAIELATVTNISDDYVHFSVDIFGKLHSEALLFTDMLFND